MLLIFFWNLAVDASHFHSKDSESKEVTGIAKSSTTLDANDILVVFGEFDDIKRLIKR